MDDYPQPGHWPTDPMNSTLSIDISQPWSASTVAIKATPKSTSSGPIGLSDQAIWKDPSGNAFYIFGGRAPYSCNRDRIKKDGIWKFTADGKGGGSWTKEKPSNPVLLNTFTLTYGAAFASSPDGVGFSIGGFAEPDTEPDLPKDYYHMIPRMLSYQMKSKTWSFSNTDMAVPPAGLLLNGRAEYVPAFGTNGLLFLMGGLVYDETQEGRQKASHTLDFNNITFYDPVDGKWRYQQTQGYAPTERQTFCMVGITSHNGTYEM